jgi:hypothetical protein
MLTDIVKSCHQRALDQQKVEGHLKLERGFATIPLPGIDVPFHSRYLWAGVMPFRACTSECVLPILGLTHHSRFVEEDQRCGSESRYAGRKIYP